MEGFRVLEGIRDGLGGLPSVQRGAGLVVGDLQGELLEDLALDRHRGLTQGLCQLRDPLQLLRELLLLGVLLLAAEVGERGLERLLLAAELDGPRRPPDGRNGLTAQPSAWQSPRLVGLRRSCTRQQLLRALAARLVDHLALEHHRAAARLALERVDDRPRVLDLRRCRSEGSFSGPT